MEQRPDIPPAYLFTRRRRSWPARLRRKYHNAKRSFGIILFTSFIGFCGFLSVLWIMHSADESFNRIVDREIERTGIEPTRDAAERRALRDRKVAADKYFEAKYGDRKLTEKEAEKIHAYVDQKKEAAAR